MGVPEMDDLQWKIVLTWIWGIPHLWKPPILSTVKLIPIVLHKAVAYGKPTGEGCCSDARM